MPGNEEFQIEHIKDPERNIPSKDKAALVERLTFVARDGFGTQMTLEDVNEHVLGHNSLYLIRENRIHEIDIVIETGSSEGMVSLNQSLLDLVRRGEISMESAMLYSSDSKSLKRLM